MLGCLLVASLVVLGRAVTRRRAAPYHRGAGAGDAGGWVVRERGGDQA